MPMLVALHWLTFYGAIKLANASVGVRYYLTERFVLRADYSIYTAFLNDTRSAEYRALTGGLSFFF